MKLAIIAHLCLVASAASAAVVTIEVGDPTAEDQPTKFSFVPDVVKVDPEDTVRFLFNGNHTVTEQSDFNECSRGTKDGGAPFDSGVMTKGQVFELPRSAMTKGATINYYCRIKEGAHCRAPNFMQGAIVISGGDSEAAGSASTETESPSKDGKTGSEGGAESSSETSKDSTITVVVGKDGNNAYSPSDIKASPGDTILFKWTGGAKKHNVVPSDQPESCVRSSNIDSDPILKALSSGAPQSSGQKKFVVPKTAKVGDTLSFYCSVGTHCSADKMYATISIVAPGTAASQSDNTDGSTTDPATDPVGLSEEASAGAVVSSASSVAASLAVLGTVVGAVFMLL